MLEWYAGLTILEQIYFWVGVVSSVALIVQIILLCFSSFGGDLDIDGDGDIDVDGDSGVSIFTLKSITAFLAVGSWAGLLTCAIAPVEMHWLSAIFVILGGGAAFAAVVFLMRAMLRLQYNGTLQTDKLVGMRATVYVSVPAERSGRGKITLNAQGRYLELDAVTDGDKITTDEVVEIISTENECTVVKRAAPAEDQDNQF